MKIIIVLIFLIFNSILWSLINSVKNNKNQNELNRVEETSKDLTGILNDGAESYKFIEITKKDKIKNKEEKKLKKKEISKKYYQKNKEKIRKNYQDYYQKNKERWAEDKKKYYQNNKEKRQEYNRTYSQKNKEKKQEYMRKYRLRKKNEKEIQQNENPTLRYIQADTSEGTSFVNPQNTDCGNIYLFI